MVNERRLPDGRVELIDTAKVEASALYNEDLAPVPASRRKWRMGSFAALWISMSACIPTYMLASSLIGQGMNWWQAILTIFLGNLIVLVPHLPGGMSDAEATSAQRDLLAAFMSENAVSRSILWFYTPAALEFADRLPA